MNDVQRQDRKLFIKELLKPSRFLGVGFFIITVYLVVTMFENLNSPYGRHSPIPYLIGSAFVVALWILNSHNAAVAKRFYNKRFSALWEGCRDRLARFDEVLKQMRKEQIADLQEMPKTIRRVGESLYFALRRADMIAFEVSRTEQEVYNAPPTWQSPSHDAQAKELYRIADKNIAEYRIQFAGVMAGVHRAEAQSAVYMTTLDSLRMKMIGYRLVGRGPELTSMDFLEAMSEAKLQLHAIDQALEELDFSQFPKMVATIPPPPPEVRHLNQGP